MALNIILRSETCTHGRNVLEITGIPNGTDTVEIDFFDTQGEIVGIPDRRQPLLSWMDVDVTEYLRAMFTHDMIMDGVFVQHVDIGVICLDKNGNHLEQANIDEQPVYYGYFRDGEYYTDVDKRAYFSGFSMKYNPERTELIFRDLFATWDSRTAYSKWRYLRWVGRKARWDYYLFRVGESSVSSKSGEDYYSSVTKKERGLQFGKYPISKSETKRLKLCALMLEDWEVDYVKEIISSPYVFMRDETNDHWYRVNVVTDELTLRKATMQDIEIEIEELETEYSI